MAPDTVLWVILLLGVFSQGVTWTLLVIMARQTSGLREVMSRFSVDLRTQTYVLKRAYRNQIERNDAQTQQEICAAMLESGVYDSKSNRDALVARLDDKFAGTLRRPEDLSPATDLRIIINRAWRWSDGLILDLLEYAIQDLDGSASGRKLRQIRTELKPYLKLRKKAEARNQAELDLDPDPDPD